MSASKLIPFLALSSVVAAVVIACTGEDVTATDGLEPGKLGGECLANGSCNTGLTCTLVDGKAKCANATTPSNEAGVVADTGANDADVVRTQCPFAATSSICPGKVACYPRIAPADASDPQAQPSCAETADECPVGALAWECNSPHYAGGTCCLTADLLTSSPTCSEAKIQLAGKGTKSLTDGKCPQGQLQLCQANNQCPPDQYCSPVRILGEYTVKDTILGVCVE